MTVAIVDYGSGNLHSAAKAFERAARESKHSQPIKVTSDPDVVRHADRVVLPGVGAFADCRRGLDAIPGMVDALEEGAAVRQLCRAGGRHLAVGIVLGVLAQLFQPGFVLRQRALALGQVAGDGIFVLLRAA